MAERVPACIEAETLRLLGMERISQDAELSAKMDSLYHKLKAAAATKSISRRFAIKLCGDIVDFGSFAVSSASLAKVLENCQNAFLLAVTLGHGADRLISRLEKEDMSEAVIADALASAMADGLCDLEEMNIFASIGAQEHLTMRFSPGYEDMPLEFSVQIIEALDAGRKAGIGVTKSFMLAPVKSVTAILGVSSREEERGRSCDVCAASDSCLYRKRGLYCGIHH